MGLMMAAAIPNTQNHEYFHLSILKPVSSSPNLQSKLAMKNDPHGRVPANKLSLQRPNQEWIKIVKDGDIYFSWYSDDRKTPVSKVVSWAD